MSELEAAQVQGTTLNSNHEHMFTLVILKDTSRILSILFLEHLKLSNFYRTL